MKFMRGLSFVLMLACFAPLAQAQFLFGPQQARPFEVLGHKSGWIMLNVWSVPAFEVVDTKSGKAISRPPVKGDRIRLLVDMDLWVAGYWKDCNAGKKTCGDPLVSPAKVPFNMGAAAHAKISAKTEVLVEEVATSTEGMTFVGLDHVLWARVSSLEDKK